MGKEAEHRSVGLLGPGGKRVRVAVSTVGVTADAPQAIAGNGSGDRIAAVVATPKSGQRALHGGPWRCATDRDRGRGT